MVSTPVGPVGPNRLQSQNIPVTQKDIDLDIGLKCRHRWNLSYTSRVFDTVELLVCCHQVGKANDSTVLEMPSVHTLLGGNSNIFVPHHSVLLHSVLPKNNTAPSPESSYMVHLVLKPKYC